MTQTERTRQLNDQLRQEMPHGSIRLRGGAKQLSNNQLIGITQLIRAFNDFRPDSDVSELRDNGVVEFDDVKVVWMVEERDDTVAVQGSGSFGQKGKKRELVVMLATESEQNLETSR